MTLVLDAGAFIALDRNDRTMWTRLKDAQRRGEVPVTHGGVIGQAWRDGSRQASLARAVGSTDIRPLDERLGRLAGELLAAAGTSDVIDAALALVCRDGDLIITSDVEDLAHLLTTAARDVELVRP